MPKAFPAEFRADVVAIARKRVDPRLTTHASKQWHAALFELTTNRTTTRNNNAIDTKRPWCHVDCNQGFRGGG